MHYRNKADYPSLKAKTQLSEAGFIDTFGQIDYRKVGFINPLTGRTLSKILYFKIQKDHIVQCSQYKDETEDSIGDTTLEMDIVISMGHPANPHERITRLEYQAMKWSLVIASSKQLINPKTMLLFDMTAEKEEYDQYISEIKSRIDNLEFEIETARLDLP